MLRVYSANYTAKDFTQLSEILRIGIDCVCQGVCSRCEYYKICDSINKCITYCDIKRNKLIGSTGKRE